MASSSSSSPEISAPLSNQSNRSELSLQHRLQEVLEDLSSRFILNLPEVELASIERVCFQVEQAHWYYEDFIREEDPGFPTMTLKKFSSSLFNVCPFLKHFGHDHDQAFQSFLAYKTRVPVCGAIMLNETWDKCLLVKGWKSTAAWSFPKGKINEQEPRHRCAIREVLEETGYDLDSQINPDDVVDISIKEQSISLFIVPNIPEDFPFETRTRKEISKISWFRLTDLPTWKRNKPVPGKFYLIAPFIGPLKTYIRERKPQNVPRKPLRRPAHPIDSHQQGSSDEEVTGTHSHTGSSTHGSSSHSSVDNGEPLTPSPLRSEAIVHDPADLHISNAADPEQTVAPDSHLAFLLSSLTKSALSTPSQNSAETITQDASNLRTSDTQAKSTPPPQTSNSEIVRTTSTVQRPPATSHFGPVSPTSSQGADAQRVPSIPSHTSIVASQTASSDQSTLSQTSTTTPVSPRTSRRSTGLSADISPYFSRASAVPGISKQMKYLTMLETVAKESERMTPKLERQIQKMEGMSPSQFPNTLTPGPRNNYPLIPGTVDRTQGPNFGLPFHPILPPNPNSFNLSQRDPFTVRPRTSNSFHPVPYTSHLPRASMNDEQIRLMMAGVSPRPTAARSATSFSSYPLPLHNLPPVPPIPPPTIPPPQLGQAPLRVVPPQYLAQLPPREMGPLTAPPISPTFPFRPNPASNAHLLSILNTPNMPRAATTMPPAAMDSHA